MLKIRQILTQYRLLVFSLALLVMLIFPNRVFADQDSDQNDLETKQALIIKQIQSFAQTVRPGLSEAGENIIHSPLSYYLALLALEPGLTGEEQAMLDQHLVPAELSHEDYYLTLGMILKDATNQEQGAFNTKTHLLADVTKELNPRYTALADPLGVVPQTVDFQEQATYQRLNEDIADFTNGLIDPYFTNERIEDLTENNELALVLMNLLYFQGNWGSEFNKSMTDQAPFYGATQETTVDMMNQEQNFSYLDHANYQAIRLPYLNGASLIVVLPKEAQTDAVMWDYFNEVLTDPNMLEYQQVNLFLPKWEASSALDLTPTLELLGLASFQKDLGETEFFLTKDPLAISQILQRIEFVLDETGTEAAAVTEIMVETTAAPIEEEPIEMVINRPFVYGIEYNGLPLFEGIIKNIE